MSEWVFSEERVLRLMKGRELLLCRIAISQRSTMFSLDQEYWRQVVMAKEIENFLQLALLSGN